MNEVNKNTSPAISVIVPVYNAEKTLRQCVDSILSQEFKDFELLLVDDGSKDGSPAICDEYAEKDARVRVFHKENGGVSSARNVGLDNAKGEWITFIDSDDFVTEGYFDGVVGSEEAILIKGYKSFNHNGIVGSRTYEELNKISDLKGFLNHYLTDSLVRCPWSKFYKKSIIGNLRFLTDMRIGEDAFFVFKYFAVCKSFAVHPNGEYMVRLAEQPDEVKYAVSVDYAVQSLSHLKEAFEGLVHYHGIEKSLFLSYIGYYKRISQSDWHKSKMKWYGNKNVKAFYDYVWPTMNIKQKSRLIMARLFQR